MTDVTSQDPREDGLYQRAQTRETPLLSKLADLTGAEWDELTHRMRKHFERALSERGYTIVASDRLAGLEWVEASAKAAADLPAEPWALNDLRRALGWDDLADAVADEAFEASLSRSEATEKGAPSPVGWDASDDYDREGSAP